MTWAAAFGALGQAASTPDTALPAMPSGDAGPVTFGNYTGNLTSAGSDKTNAGGGMGLDWKIMAVVVVGAVVAIKVFK